MSNGKVNDTTKNCPLDKGCDGNYCCVKSCQWVLTKHNVGRK